MNQPMPKNIIAGPRCGIKGEYRCVLNEGTSREVDSGWFPELKHGKKPWTWFPNLLTNIGLDKPASGATTVQYGSIGTGTTAPANGNTTLVAYVAEVTSITGFDGQSNIGAPTYAAEFQVHWTYPQGSVVGNMAEVGAGWAAGGTGLFSRALILDGGGMPTTLTVTSIDQLTVYYKLTATPDILDISGTVTLDGIVYDYVGRPASVDLWSASLFADINSSAAHWGVGSGAGGHAMESFSTQVLGAITSNPAGAASFGNSGAASFGSYAPGQKYLDNVFTAAPLECNSAGGIGSILFFFQNTQQQYQYTFSAQGSGNPIPKDNTKTLALTLRFAWDRV